MDNKTYDKMFGMFKQLHRKEELHQLVNLVSWFKPKTILETEELQGADGIGIVFKGAM